MLCKRQNQLYDSKEFFSILKNVYGLLLNMKIKASLSAVFALLFLSVVHFGQTPSPTPPNDEDVVKISTNLIQIDVTVTDKKGNVVTDLKPEEVEIYENGKRQDISNFSFVSNLKTAPPPEQNKEKPKNAVPLPPTTIRPEQVHRTIALVVDDLTLSFESTFFVRKALKKFVDEQMQDGDLVAIIRTGAGIGALQQFTNDKRQLYAAIEKVRWNPAGTGNVGAFAPMEGKPDNGQDQKESEPGERTPEGIENEFNDFRESVFATGTLGAINYIVRGMQDLPGRKSILLLSDGFKLFSRTADGSIETGRVLQSLRRLVDMANRASVVIYTMDARGLQVTGLTAADDTSGRTPEQIETALSDRRSQLIDTQQGLQYLAQQTGGLSIINNNDLVGGIRRILDDQSYYLVGYQPDDATFDPKTRRFNKLEVKVTRPGLKVRYRSGFFGITDEKMQRPQLTSGQRLVAALTSPFAVNDVSVRLNALFGNDAKNGSYIRSLLHIRAQDLKFTDEPDGSKKVIFDVLAVGFGDNGLAVDQISKTYTLTAKKDVYDLFMKDGMVYDFTFPIKKAGAYQLRVALHDHGNEKIGSANQFVEVPNIKKDRLTLSGVFMQNFSIADWNKINGMPAEEARKVIQTNPLADTSLRQFKRGTVLNYGFSVYNAKLGTGQKPDLSMTVRVIRDGKMLLDSKPVPINSEGQPDLQRINVSKAVSLGSAMPTGDYVMQVVVTDNLAKEKRKLATQFVQFEIVQ